MTVQLAASPITHKLRPARPADKTERFHSEAAAAGRECHERVMRPIIDTDSREPNHEGRPAQTAPTDGAAARDPQVRLTELSWMEGTELRWRREKGRW